MHASSSSSSSSSTPLSPFYYLLNTIPLTAMSKGQSVEIDINLVLNSLAGCCEAMGITVKKTWRNPQSDENKELIDEHIQKIFSEMANVIGNTSAQQEDLIDRVVTALSAKLHELKGVAALYAPFSNSLPVPKDIPVKATPKRKRKSCRKKGSIRAKSS